VRPEVGAQNSYAVFLGCAAMGGRNSPLIRPEFPPCVVRPGVSVQGAAPIILGVLERLCGLGTPHVRLHSSSELPVLQQDRCRDLKDSCAAANSAPETAQEVEKLQN
jgi:hypothetical protein